MIQRKDWDLFEYSFKDPEQTGNRYIGESFQRPTGSRGRRGSLSGLLAWGSDAMV